MVSDNATETEKSTFIQRLYSFGFPKDAVTLLKMSIPLSTGYILSSAAIPAVSLTFMGHLGQAELNASALVNTVYLLICGGLMLGLNSGCDTLLPQYYGGNKPKMGIIWQRGMFIAVYGCFVSWILMLNAKYVLSLIVTDTQVIILANIYLQEFLPIAPLAALSMSLQIYIGTSQKTMPILIINIIGNLINILSHYICIYQFYWGIHSAPVSIIIANASIVLAYLIYIRVSPLYTDPLHPITRACLQEWKIYLKYALPGVLMTMAEYWSIETCVLFAARINKRSLSAQAVVQQVVFMAYMIIKAVGDAGNILIGEKLGMNQPMEAINAKNFIYAVTSLFIACTSTVIIVSHRWLPYIFSVEAEAVPLTQNGILLAAVVNVLDGYQTAQVGIAKACGMQRFTSIVYIICFDVVGIPVAYILTFIIHLDIYGFWIGMIIAETFINIILFIAVWRFDWHAYTKEVIERTVVNLTSGLSEDEVSLNTSEHLQLLPYKADEQINTNLNMEEPIPLRSNKELYKSPEIKSEESLSKLLTMKLTVLFPLFCLFILSIVMSYK